eukprot:scaffold179186_cov23-Tisochrysis_lutea.AAC.2
MEKCSNQGWVTLARTRKMHVCLACKRTEKARRQRKLSLQQVRKRRHIGSEDANVTLHIPQRGTGTLCNGYATFPLINTAGLIQTQSLERGFQYELPYILQVRPDHEQQACTSIAGASMRGVAGR